ncbi:MAG: T9SS type A sorting domain-containing protein [Bacteroidota bacterium]
MKTPGFLKFALLVSFMWSSVALGQLCNFLVDLEAEVTGNQLVIKAEPTAAPGVATFCSSWNPGCVMTVRWLANADGSNPVSAVSITNPTAADFVFIPDALAGTTGTFFKDTGAPVSDPGYYYFPMITTASATVALPFPGQTNILQLDFTLNNPATGFEIANGVEWTTDNNADPALNLVFGNRVGTINNPTFPVEWLDFVATPINSKDVLLTWATSQEQNNDYFEVQKSVDRNLFQGIGKVPGNGNTTQVSEYQFLDEQYLSDKVYYRVKQIDFNGGFSYSDVVEVNFADAVLQELSFSIYPNPASEFIEVKALGRLERDMPLTVVDNLGKTVFEGSMTEREGKITIQVEDLPSGIYYVQMSDANSGQIVSAGRFIRK